MIQQRHDTRLLMQMLLYELLNAWQYFTQYLFKYSSKWRKQTVLAQTSLLALKAQQSEMLLSPL